MERQSHNGEPLGFEDTLWKAADKLRGSMDASEYKHIVLGLGRCRGASSTRIVASGSRIVRAQVRLEALWPC